jgi:hypothetical protein
MAVYSSNLVKVQYEGATSGTYVDVAQVQSVTLPDITCEKVSTTHLGTTGAKTFRPNSLVETNDMTFTIQHDPDETTHVALWAKVGANALNNWRVVLNGSTLKTYTISGFVGSWAAQESTEEDNNNLVDITVACSGVPVLS